MPKRSKRRRGGGFSYRENDAAEGRRMAEGSGDFDNPLKGDVKSFKAADGKNRVRILPRTWDDDDGPRHWGLEVWVHYGIGADNSAYLCLKKMKGERCPICEERERLAAEGDEDAAREIRPVKRIIAYAIDRKNEDEGPMVWWMPAHKIAAEVADRSDDPDTGKLLKIDHPEKGYDVTFRKSGSGMKTQYTGVDVARRSSPISDDPDEMDDWLEQISEAPLPSLLNYYDAAYLEDVFGGTASRPDDADDEDDEPPPRSKRRRRRDEDDESENDDLDALDDPEDEEDDDPPPRSRRRRSRRVVDDEESEEDEKPKRRKRDLRDDVDRGLRGRRRRRSRD